MTQVRKAVIAAAGLGTRFLPASKSVPKEMLPILDRPMIHYAVEEAALAGIEQVIIITSRGKQAMEDYFDRAPELERVLEAKGDIRGLEVVRYVAKMVEIHYVRQQEQLGLGHAVLAARQAVDDEPFALFLPDDIIISPVPAVRQLMTVFEERQGSVVAVEQVGPEQISSYGVVAVDPPEGRVYRVNSLVEKPIPREAPSDLGIVGRYVLTPAIFDCLERTPRGAIGEIQLTDGMAVLLQEQPLFACLFQGMRWDVGNPLGMLQASIGIALKREDLGSDIRTWLALRQL